MTEVEGRADVEATRTRVRGRERPADSSVGVNRLHRSGPRSNVANRHAGRLARLHVGGAHVKQAQHPCTHPQWLRGAPGHPSGPGSPDGYPRPLSLAVLDDVGAVRDGAVGGDDVAVALAPRPASIDRRAVPLRVARPVATRASTHVVPDGKREARRCRVGCARSLVDTVELGLGRVARAGPVVEVGDGARDEPLRRVRVQRAGREIRRRSRRSPPATTPVACATYIGSSVVGDAHDLAELLRRRLGDARRSCRATSTSSARRRGRRAAASSSTTCASWPACCWRWRPMIRLKSWSVPPSSTSARTSTESIALQQRVEELHQRDRRRRPRSAWRSRRARACGRR